MNTAEKKFAFGNMRGCCYIDHSNDRVPTNEQTCDSLTICILASGITGTSNGIDTLIPKQGSMQDMILTLDKEMKGTNVEVGLDKVHL